MASTNHWARAESALRKVAMASKHLPASNKQGRDELGKRGHASRRRLPLTGKMAPGIQGPLAAY